MNPVGEGGNQSPITAPTSIADAPPVIGGTEPINQPINSATPKIPGDAVAAEAKASEAEKNVLDALNIAAQTGSSPVITKEDPPKSPVEDYLAKFGDKSNQISGEEPKIDLSPTPTLTNLNQPPTGASPDAASRNTVTLDDLLTKGPQAVFDEPAPAAAAVDNTVPAAEISPKPEDPQAVFVQDVRNAFAKLDAATKVKMPAA